MNHTGAMTKETRANRLQNPAAEDLRLLTGKWLGVLSQSTSKLRQKNTRVLAARLTN